jgi:hypothetical protein
VRELTRQVVVPIVYSGSIPNQFKSNLVPPSLCVGAEIKLRPGREDNPSIFSDVAVSKGERKRGWSTDNSTSGGVLGSVAWALELIGSSRPWNNTSQMSAHGVKTIALECLVFLNNQIAVKSWLNDRATW